MAVSYNFLILHVFSFSPSYWSIPDIILYIYFLLSMSSIRTSSVKEAPLLCSKFPPSGIAHISGAQAIFEWMKEYMTYNHFSSKTRIVFFFFNKRSLPCDKNYIKYLSAYFLQCQWKPWKLDSIHFKEKTTNLREGELLVKNQKLVRGGLVLALQRKDLHGSTPQSNWQTLFW